MKRDAPHWIDPDEDIMSIHDSQSDVEMVSAPEYDWETEDSLPDSGAENSHHPSDGSDMNPIRTGVPVAIPTLAPNRALISVQLWDLTPV